MAALNRHAIGTDGCQGETPDSFLSGFDLRPPCSLGGCNSRAATDNFLRGRLAPLREPTSRRGLNGRVDTISFLLQLFDNAVNVSHGADCSMGLPPHPKSATPNFLAVLRKSSSSVAKGKLLRMAKSR